MKKPAIDLAGMETAETLARLRAQRVNPNSPFFVQWMWTMATEPSLTNSERWHATVLALFADWSTGEDCRPARDVVSSMTGLEERTIQEHMRKFKALGLISTNTPGRGRPLVSKLLLKVVNKVAEDCHPIDSLGSRELPPEKSLGGNLTDSLGGNPAHPSLVLSQLSTHTTLRPDAEETPPPAETTTTTTTTTTRADAWRKAMAGNPPPAKPEVDFRKDYDELAEALFTTANGAMARGLPGLEVLSEPIRWLEGGADLHLDVLPVIKARAAKARPGSIRSWGYFGAAVFEARAARTTPPPDVKPVDRNNNKGYTEPTKAENDDFWNRLSAKIKEKENAKSNGPLPETLKAIF
jgi:hypothetical protein